MNTKDLTIFGGYRSGLPPGIELFTLLIERTIAQNNHPTSPSYSQQLRPLLDQKLDYDNIHSWEEVLRSREIKNSLQHLDDVMKP